MTNPSAEAVDRLRADRERGASALAKDAVEILAAATSADRQALAERLAALRPSMPAIAADGAQSGSWAGIRIQASGPHGPFARRELQPLNRQPCF